MEAPIRVLCVDDEPALLLTLAETLRQNGFEVTAAGSVNEALHEISHNSFDVLLSDLNLGHPSDGLTVVSAMRRTQPECVTLILTGFPGFDTALQALRLQVDDFLVKPAPVPILLGFIRESLNKRAPHEATATKRIADVLRENVFEISQLFLRELQSEPRMAELPLTDEQRIEYTPNVVLALAEMLEAGDSIASERTLNAAEVRGRRRYHYGFTAPMLVTHIRLLERVIYDVIQRNLAKLNMSYFMSDLKQLNESLGLQLEHSLIAYAKEGQTAGLPRG